MRLIQCHWVYLPPKANRLFMQSMSKRPEHLAPPEIFYDDTEAQKYTANSRIAAIQVELVPGLW